MIADGAVVRVTMVFAHSNNTLELLELLSMKMAFISLDFCAGSTLHSFLSISRIESWKISPIS